MKHLARSIYYNGFLFVANRMVSRVPIHWFRLFFYRHFMRFSIGSCSYIFMDAWFDSKGKGSFIMGNNSVVNQRCRLDTRGSILIGSNVSISAEVCILTADHDLQSPTFEGRTKTVSIADFVFVGTRAMILPGVVVGRGAAIGAGAVVTRNVPEYAIVAGCPAVQIGSRDPSSSAYMIEYGRLFH